MRAFTTAQESNLEPSIPLNSSLTLDEAITNYEQAIQTAKGVGSNPSLDLVLEVLFARDCIETYLSKDGTNITTKTLLHVVNLDDQFRRLSQIFSSREQLAHCRSTIKPPQTSWWWFWTPQAERPPKRFSWTSQDWLWNGLTVACLFLSTGFITNTLKAFSQDGLDLLQTCGAIGQGAGLILVSGGALTDKGKRGVANILTSFNVPSVYQAEVTFACSAAILAITYGINRSLPNLGDYYYTQGQIAYEKGLLLEAEEHFKQAMNFAPDNYNISTDLGNLYETINLHNEARSMYQIGILAGHPDALNGKGRVLLRTAGKNENILQPETNIQLKKDLRQAEANFRLALANPNLSPALQAEVHAHLGLTLIKQASVDNLTPEEIKTILATAEHTLRQGNEIDQTITENRDSGLGMGYCYLAEVLEQQEKSQEATKQWDLCATRATPTSISEYQDILIFGDDQIIDRIDVSHILKDSLN